MSRPIEERMERVSVRLVTPLDMMRFAALSDEAMKEYVKRNAAMAVAEQLLKEFDDIFRIDIREQPEGLSFYATLEIVKPDKPSSDGLATDPVRDNLRLVPQGTTTMRWPR